MFIAKTGESSSPDPKCRLTCVPLILIRPASLGPHRLLPRISYLIILLTTLSVNTNRLQYLTTFTSSPLNAQTNRSGVHGLQTDPSSLIC
ncbi:hypothetical protein BDV27DRAFT_132010 [Aspergillus caelatus]|uniref:Uncharacterized protein n=2 Tax=Aspergillus subgen. Circumdati TaxID=2720871 RepID=A0A5N6ZX03_9EURO|nr:uncharacterized protein BDV27DRAFT_132010 [Aspergillus caelatus]KAE8362151.1 hypothetical protein BDV27DRAFT_132010 [Aspergillus caelatus]KAE8413922.1 hypothetical protein BDV36DRAFT_267080 [Aspergillus pseudocaelatus]